MVKIITFESLLQDKFQNNCFHNGSINLNLFSVFLIFKSYLQHICYFHVNFESKSLMLEHAWPIQFNVMTQSSQTYWQAFERNRTKTHILTEPIASWIPSRTVNDRFLSHLITSILRSAPVIVKLRPLSRALGGRSLKVYRNKHWN